MSRWEPDARSRLENAARDLFAEQGYEATTVAEIAERAGLTKRTFFRHFADKREVLFSGQEELTRLAAEAIDGAPASAGPLDAVAALLDAVGGFFGQDRLDLVRQRQALVAAHSDLQERELLKTAALTEALTRALRRRGVPDPAASVAAELGRLGFHNAFAAWVAPGNTRPFAEVAREVWAELTSAAAKLF